MYILELFGRIFLSVLFLSEGIRKFFFQEETIIYMEDFGVPEIFFFPSIFVEIFFPLLLIIGYKTKIAASVMVLFTLTVAIIFHTNFNNGMQMTFFLKDLAIAGGFIIILINGAGLLSVDRLQKSKTK